MEGNKNTNDLKSIQDFEMGGESVKINHYDNAPTAPNKPSTTNPQNGTPPQKPLEPPVAPPHKKAFKLLMWVCGGVLTIFLGLSFLFLAQSGSEPSAIATLLGLDEVAFTKALILFIHIIFGLFAALIFIVAAVNFFKVTTTKKEDKETKKRFLKKTFIAGGALLFVIIVWAFSSIYLNNKRLSVEDPIVFIVTDPAETLGLTAPVDVRFDASNIPVDRTKYQIVSHEWDFDDGSTGTNQIVSHRFEKKGVYEVKLTLNLQDKESGQLLVGGEYQTIVSIANQELSAIFSATPESGEAPLTVQFDASDSVDPDGTIDSYEWDLTGNNIFDDAEGSEVEHTFDRVGTYNVSLRVTNKTGDFDVSTMKIEVTETEDAKPVITIIDEPKTLQTNIAYAFDGGQSTSPSGKIVSYVWDFGDGSRPATTKTVSHAFKTAGTYKVKLTVKDEENNLATSERTLTLRAPQGLPKPKITSEPALSQGQTALSGRAPFNVILDGRASTDPDNNIVQYKWDLGNGSAPLFGDVVNATFSQAGKYEVTLTVTDADDNLATTTQLVEVLPQGVTAALSTNTLSGPAPLTVSFDASGSAYAGGEIASYRWDFGDDTPIQLGISQITHRYESIGTYVATVTVIGTDNSQAQKSVNIAVREIPLTACFVTPVDSGSAPLDTQFDPTCSTGSAASYFWNFGDGTTSNQIKPSHTFENPGQYVVKLEITDNNSNVSIFEKVITVER